MKIELQIGIQFELEPDITVLIGAGSMRLYGLLQQIAQLPDVLFADKAITTDGDELRVKPILVDKNRWQVALFHCPETYIHPWRYHKLFEILQGASQHKRILLTTYSPLFLNRFEPRMVRVVEHKKADSGVYVPHFKAPLVIRPIDCAKVNGMLNALDGGILDGGLGELWFRDYLGGNPPGYYPR